MGLKLQPQNGGETIFVARRTTLGRSRDGVRYIDDVEASRRHAEIYQQFVDNQPKWFITDLNSVNGTYVNGQRINHPMILKDQDEVKLGRKVYRVTIDQTYIWNGVGDQAPVLEHPQIIIPVSPDQQVPPHQPLSSQHINRGLRIWELLGLVGILGIGWLTTRQKRAVGLLWMLLGMLWIFLTGVAWLVWRYSAIIVGGWIGLVILTSCSLLLLQYALRDSQNVE